VSETAPFLTPHERTNYYVFAQDEWAFAPDWNLTSGLRYDHYSDFGNTVNPRFALVWQTRYNLTTKLLYGSAFRAPSFVEEFNINNPVVLGNPNLEPETINWLELAFDYQHSSDLRMGLNLFRYRMSDIIRFVPDPAPATSATAQNTGEQTGYGLEWEFSWRASRNVLFYGNYAFQRSEDESTNTDAGNAPHHQFYLRADWRFRPEWHLTPQVLWIADRERVVGDPRPDPDDYQIVDLTLRRTRIRDHWDAAVSVRNLFDEDAREPSPAPGLILNDLPLPGRSFYVELRYLF
jgi:iron complex outermembrane receptor protein